MEKMKEVVRLTQEPEAAVGKTYPQAPTSPDQLPAHPDGHRKDLNGLEKMKEVVRLTQEPEWSSLSRQSLPLLKNPRLLGPSPGKAAARR